MNNQNVISKKSKVYEPLFHIVKREDISNKKSMLIRISAVLMGFVVCAVLALLLIKINPIEFFESVFKGSFGTEIRIWRFANETAILLCIALAITPAFRMKFWNIGAEGQAMVGALAAVFVVVLIGEKLPNWALLILMFLAAVIVGAIWGVIPAIFKALWNTNETLFTLMMNYIATGLVSYFLAVWTKEGNGSSTLGMLKTGYLPEIYNEHLLLIFAVLGITMLMYAYLYHTKHGYEVSVVGESVNTAQYIGINVKKVIIRTMFVSGAICGIAGFLIVAGNDHSITTVTVGGLGFVAIMVSWLAKFNPLVMIGTAGFITFLDQGVENIPNINDSFPDMVVGIILFFLIGCEFFINYKLKFRSFGKKGANQ